MATKYEKNVYLAMLAEQCSRYKEMVQFLEDMVKQRDKDLNSDERNLLSIAYKNSISGGRSAVRTIMAYEAKEKKKENSTFLPYITEYKKQVEDELTKLCQGVLKTTDEQLLKKAEDDEAKVFYIKMKGDYNRYIAEYAEGDLKKQVSDDALKAYDEATEIAKTLPVLNPIGLGLALNFSVFYYEVINDHKKAIEIAKAAVEKADKELPNIDEDADENRDTVSIYNLLKENLDMWVSEEEGDLKKQVSDDALKAYDEATEIAKTLPVLNPIALGLALNFSVFYYEVINDHKKAIEIAKAAVEKADKELPNIDEDADENRDTVSIYNLLKENLDMWVSEEEGDQ